MFAVLISKKPLKYFVSVIVLTSLLNILLYILTIHHLSIPKDLRVYYEPDFLFNLKIPAMVGFFTLAIAIVSFREWKDNRLNGALFGLWIGPLFTLIFLTAMWITIGFLLNAYSSTGYYYVVPAMGMSLFLAALLSGAMDKFKTYGFRLLTYLFIVICIFFYYRSSKQEIFKDFPASKPVKVNIMHLNLLHNELITRLREDKTTYNVLVFLDLPGNADEKLYYSTAFLGFNYVMMWNDITKGCVAYIVDKNVLISAYRKEQSIFSYPETCFTGINVTNIFSIDDLYAYRLENDSFIDIKGTILNELKIH